MPNATSRMVFAPRGSQTDVEQGGSLSPKFDQAGLLAAVATDWETGEVLMLAWMSADSLALSIETGEAHFYSRSHKRIWKKGEESGNVLEIIELRTDCDQDAIWMRVRMRGQGAACHTGYRTCFYRRIPIGRTTDGRTLSLTPAGTPQKFAPPETGPKV